MVPAFVLLFLFLFFLFFFSLELNGLGVKGLVSALLFFSPFYSGCLYHYYADSLGIEPMNLFVRVGRFRAVL